MADVEKVARAIPDEAVEAVAQALVRHAWAGSAVVDGDALAASGGFDAKFYDEARVAISAYLAAMGEREAEPVAWMRRWAADKIDVMALKKAERPGGWHLHATTEAKLLADDVPLYASPRPEAVGEAVKAERERCAKIADEHPEAWGTAMASPAIVIAAAIRSGT